MGNRKASLAVFIIAILLLGFVFQHIVNSSSAKKNNTVNETERFVSLTSTKNAVSSPDIKEADPEPDVEQTYESPRGFPYNDLRFADEKIFEVIKRAYKSINFYSEFKRGDLEIYDIYKMKYEQLLKNEVTFINKKGEASFLSEYSPLKVYKDIGEAEYNVNNYNFCFFDIDDDGAPVLCINVRHSPYIFKYIPDFDNIILWYETGISWYSLNGSNTMRWDREGISHVFYRLGKDGEDVYSVYFFLRENFNRRINQAEVVYMVSLPKYTNGDKQIKISKEVKDQGYYDRGQKIYYFRVTEKQYAELTEDYFNAERLAEENIKEVTFTYDELFGDF